MLKVHYASLLDIKLNVILMTSRQIQLRSFLSLDILSEYAMKIILTLE